MEGKGVCECICACVSVYVHVHVHVCVYSSSQKVIIPVILLQCSGASSKRARLSIVPLISAHACVMRALRHI